MCCDEDEPTVTIEVPLSALPLGLRKDYQIHNALVASHVAATEALKLLEGGHPKLAETTLRLALKGGHPRQA